MTLSKRQLTSNENNLMTEPYDISNLTNKSFPLDRYEPISLLGRGGLGEVYLAKDRLLGRTIAVKCLMAVDDEQVVIFQREAKIASKLNHPCIIGTLDFGTTEGGRPFIAFDYFDGISLEHLLLEHGGTIDEQLARRIFVIVTEALDYIHKHNVFHRDLKPSNILLKFDKSDALDLRIIDFGVSAIREEFQNRDLAQGKTIVGTPVYMSPDPVRGDAFDARSEVYSIGCILFECLTGEPPFDSASTAEVLELHMTEEPPLLKDVCPDRSFSPEMQEIITKCLSKTKSDRFQTMAELKAALERPVAKSKRTIESAPPVESKKNSGAGKSVVLIVAAICCILVGRAVVISIISASEQKDEHSLVLQRQDELAKGSTSGLHVKTDQSLELQKAKHDNARGIYISGSDSVKRLQEIADAGQTKDMVSFNNLTLTLTDVENLKVVKPKLIQMFKCEIPEDVFAKLMTVSSVGELSFQQCPDITPECMALLKESKSIVTLKMIGCGINDKHLREIGHLKQLRKLVLDGNKDITLDGLLHLKRKDGLIAVWLNEGPLTELTDQELSALKEKYNIVLSTKLERYEGEGGDGLVNPDALELLE